MRFWNILPIKMVKKQNLTRFGIAGTFYSINMHSSLSLSLSLSLSKMVFIMFWTKYNGSHMSTIVWRKIIIVPQFINIHIVYYKTNKNENKYDYVQLNVHYGHSDCVFWSKYSFCVFYFHNNIRVHKCNASQIARSTATWSGFNS